MTLVKYNPRRFQSPFGDLFEDMFSSDIGKIFGSNDVPMVAPKVNIKETDNAFELEMMVPGHDKKDLYIAIENNVLSVSAEVEKEELKEGERFTRKEHIKSSFTRRFTLPEDVQEEKVKAEFKNGMLNITIPKEKEAEKVSRTVRIS